MRLNGGVGNMTDHLKIKNKGEKTMQNKTGEDLYNFLFDYSQDKRARLKALREEKQRLRYAIKKIKNQVEDKPEAIFNFSIFELAALDLVEKSGALRETARHYFNDKCLHLQLLNIDVDWVYYLFDRYKLSYLYKYQERAAGDI